MANWRAITIADVRTQLSSREIQAVGLNGTAPGETDPTAATILAVVDRVRGAIASHRPNILGAAATVPESLVDPTVSIVIWRLMSRSGGQVIDGEANPRRDAYKDAIRLLEQIAEGKLVIAEPDTGALPSPLSVIPIIYDWGHEEEFRRDQQDGA